MTNSLKPNISKLNLENILHFSFINMKKVDVLIYRFRIIKSKLNLLAARSLPLALAWSNEPPHCTVVFKKHPVLGVNCH